MTKPISLEHLQVGDKLAICTGWERFSGFSRMPAETRITHEILTITRRTPTQLQTSSGCVVRIKDGMLIGHTAGMRVHATPATQELLEAHEAQKRALERWHAARSALGGLIGKELHQLRLSIEQIEHLAKAWAEVQAMP